MNRFTDYVHTNIHTGSRLAGWNVYCDSSGCWYRALDPFCIQVTCDRINPQLDMGEIECRLWHTFLQFGPVVSTNVQVSLTPAQRIGGLS